MQKILVVDDAAVNRELLREMLEDNYVIEMAENGQQALRKLLEFKEELAAVPGMNSRAARQVFEFFHVDMQ